MAKAKYVCTVCGWSIIAEEQPEICPVCGVDTFDKIEIDENEEE